MTSEEIINEVENIQKFNYTLAPDEVFDKVIEALKQNESLKEMVKLGIAKDCESCKAHRVDVLDKIRAEIIDESYLSYDGNPRHIIDESWVLDIIDKYRESKDKG